MNQKKWKNLASIISGLEDKNEAMKIKALVLAAGYATRLYPITKYLPKPLLPVNGKPIIEYILDKLSLIDEVDEIIIVTNKKFYPHFTQWYERLKRASVYNKKITVLNDNTTKDGTKLGAIGDIKFVIDKKNILEDLLVIGGDNLFNFNLTDFTAYFNEKKKNLVALHDIKDKVAVKRFSIVELNSKNKLIDFEEKPKDPKTTLIAICAYIFKKETLPKIEEYLKKGNNPDAPGYLIEWLYKNDEMYGWVFEESWFDIGSIEQFEEANELYKRI